jgi:hypothetical protein
VKELGKEPPVLHQLKVLSWKSLVPQLEHKYWKFEFTHHHGNVNTIWECERNAIGDRPPLNMSLWINLWHLKMSFNDSFCRRFHWVIFSMWKYFLTTHLPLKNDFRKHCLPCT